MNGRLGVRSRMIGYSKTSVPCSMADLRIRMRHPRKDTFEIPSMMKHSLLGHEAIYEAIMAGDEQASADAMTAHIGSGGNVYSDAIARLS